MKRDTNLLGVQIMRKFLREKELMSTPFPEGMEEFQQLLYCENKCWPSVVL